MIIYSDNGVCDAWTTQIEAKIVKSFSEYLNLPGPKIAIFQAPFPRHIDFDHLANIFDQAYDNSDSLILLVSELHDVTVDFIENFDRPKVIFFLNGDLNFKLQYAICYHWFNWFETTANFYKQNEFLLDNLNPYDVKPKYFDILLGQKRPHRDEIFASVDEELKSKVVMTYLNDKIQFGFQGSSDKEWQWGQHGIELPNWPIRNTVHKVGYCGQMICLSQIIPTDIYNQTAYTVVAETWGTDNRFTFNTEKIVKPILAERLFLIASNQYYLRNLRALGFSTFSNVIDESYDLEPDYKLRCAMISQQIAYLAKQPQEEILAKIKPITEYNKLLMLSTDWHEEFLNSLRTVIV
jgi:hypothetical protein